MLLRGRGLPLSLALSLSLHRPLHSPPPRRLLRFTTSPAAPFFCIFLDRGNRTFWCKRKKITMASTEDKPANKENTSSWKDSIYNPRTGELLGRTASSWGKDPPFHSSQLVDVL